MVRKVEVVSYDPNWPLMFAREREQLAQALPEEVVLRLLHIGSTSVVGLSAKPIIDMLLIVEDIAAFDDYAQEMADLGYEGLGEYGLPGRRYYYKGGNQRTHQIHAYQYDNVQEIGRHIAFRDYLRTHPEVAQQYGAVKQKAAVLNQRDIEGYMDAKNDFVKDFEKKALKWMWPHT